MTEGHRNNFPEAIASDVPGRRSLRTVLVLALISLGMSSSAAAAVEPASLPTHIRCLPGGARELLTAAMSQSASVRGLVDSLEQTDVVAYLTLSAESRPGWPRASLSFVSSAAGTRYVLIRIDAWRVLSQIDRISKLGHELWHALEVAAAQEVTTENGLRELYRRIGHERNGTRFETDQARAVERDVRMDLLFPRHQ